MIGDGALAQLDVAASEQDGYFTVAQAAGAGLSAEAIANRIAGGEWTRIDGDLLRVGSWPRHELEEFSKWCALLGPTSVVSHHSAAELHGLGNLHPKFVHLSGLLPTTDQSLVIHRGLLDPSDIEFTGAFRITTPIRTMLDLAAGTISQFTLDEIVGDALSLERIDADEIGRAHV